MSMAYCGEVVNAPAIEFEEYSVYSENMSVRRNEHSLDCISIGKNPTFYVDFGGTNSTIAFNPEAFENE